MRVAVLIVASVFVFGCKKASDRSCVKSAGEEITVERELDDFNLLYLGSHLNINLVQDTVNKVLIHGGENLINFIRTDVENGKLYIVNENKCNFLRSYKKKITVELHLKKVRNIEYDATEPVFCENQIVTDYMTVTINESAGRFYLDISALELHTFARNNWGNFEITGNTNYLRIYTRGNAFGNTFGLNVADSIYIINDSGEDVDVNADGVFLRSQILSTGNIGYIGNPTQIDHTSFGEGELLNKN